MKHFFVAFAFIALLASCKNDDNSAREEALQGVAGTEATTPVAPAPGAEGAVPEEAPVPTGPLTSMTFSELEFDFGKVKDGEPVTHVFKFKNTGSEPLILSNAKGSCGCTVPEWPREPIAPGASGEINVRFDSKNKTGAQNKKVTVTANTDPANTVLTIKGEVLPDPNKKPEAAPAQ